MLLRFAASHKGVGWIELLGKKKNWFTQRRKEAEEIFARRREDAEGKGGFCVSSSPKTLP